MSTKNCRKKEKTGEESKVNIFPPAGLYIHVPFCISKCRYCDFYSLTNKRELMPEYVRRVIAAAEYYRNRYARRYNSLYFGGGTPLLLGEEQLCEILRAVSPDLEPDAEVTAEGNPAAAGSFDFAALKAAGVNRLSLGLQSSNERELAALGRIHSPQDAADTVKAAQAAGIDNISLDLMIGIPYQTTESLLESARFCAALGVRHISAYMLKIEPGTPLASSPLRALCAGDEETADMYLALAEELRRLGFEQYEISNFAKPGCESRHNLKYWRCEEYLGIGPAAHSFMDGRRFYFDRDIDGFLTQPFARQEREEGEGGGAEEYAMLRLRLCEGLDTDELAKKYPDADAEGILRRAALYVKPGLVNIDGSRISFTPKGFLLSNALSAEILYE